MWGKIWSWLYEGNPAFWDMFLTVLFLCGMVGVALLGAWIATGIFGPGPLTAVGMLVPIVFFVAIIAIHKGHPDGIRGWWSERPWKKMTRV